MPEIDDIELSTAVPVIVRQFRKSIRAGFALCASATGLILAYEIGVVLTTLLRAYSDPSQVSESIPATRLSELLVNVIALALILAGLVLLYRVPFGQRWRLTTTILLGAVGADLAFLSMRASGGTGSALAVANELGIALGWVELWMIAVLAADAAEAVERPDLTYQTEVAGRWIIGGGSAWLLSVVWSFDPGRIADASAPIPQDALTVLLVQATMVLHLFAVIRITGCCIGLVGAYVPIHNAQSPP